MRDQYTSLREWFDHFTAKTGETPTTIVFGSDEYLYDDEVSKYVGLEMGTVYTFANVPAEIMDRKFDNGYGGNDSPDFCAWSVHWVIFSDNYDGAESIRWVPRDPVNHKPIRPGGG